MRVVRGGAPDERIHDRLVLRIGNRVALLVSLRDDIRISHPIGGHVGECADRGVVESAVARVGSRGIWFRKPADVCGDDEFRVVVTRELQILECRGALIVTASAPIVEVGFEAAGDTPDARTPCNVEAHLGAERSPGAELVNRWYSLAAHALAERRAGRSQVNRWDGERCLSRRGGRGERAERGREPEKGAKQGGSQSGGRELSLFVAGFDCN